jgi:hypothetical protein
MYNTQLNNILNYGIFLMASEGILLRKKYSSFSFIITRKKPEENARKCCIESCENTKS